MDPELIAYLDQRFNSIDQRFNSIDQRFEQVDRRFEQTEEANRQTRALIEETNRQTLVLVEEVRDEVRLLAEGYLSLDDKLENFRSEATVVFDTIKGWIEPYYRDLDGRVRTLDVRSQNLDGRVRTLEGRAERQDGDVFDAVRRVLGRPARSAPIPK
jgi:chromosome segregation ATPase